MALQIGRVPGHHDQRRFLAPFDQQARLLVHRQQAGSENAAEAAIGDPVLGGFDQRPHHLQLVNGIEAAEHAGALQGVAGAAGADLGVVDLRRNAPHRGAILAGDPVLRLAMLEERRLGGIEQAPALHGHRRGVAGKAAVEPGRQGDELLHRRLAVGAFDGHPHAVTAFVSRRARSRARTKSTASTMAIPSSPSTSQ